MQRSLAVLIAMAIMVGLLAIASPTAASPETPPDVVCVPFHGELLAVPHDTWIGKETTFKGTAHDADGDATMVAYMWDFGDGYSTGWIPGVDPYVIEARHTYTGTMADGTPYGPGKYFTAWLYVEDDTGLIGQDSYFVAIRDVSDPGEMLKVEVNVAIDNGLWWLHKQQIRGTYPDGADYGYWENAGFEVAATAAAVEAFELQGHLPKGDPYDISEDPYVETVQRGLNYLFNHMEERLIGQDPASCPLGDPDLNGNGIGLACYSGHEMYESGMALMTMASSKAPDRVATTGPVAGRTYLEITQDMVDFMAWGQNEQVGEFIYRDVDASDDVSPGDVRIRLCIGDWCDLCGTLVVVSDWDVGWWPLVPFAAEDKHGDPDGNGLYEWEEPIYRDLDGSNDVSIGDERLSNVGTYEAGSIVASGDPDLGEALVAFTGDEKHIEIDDPNFAYDWGNGRGGWRYGANSWNSDNSVSQWPVIGLEAAERNLGDFGLAVPEFVRPELLRWLTYSQCTEPDERYGGFGYRYPCDWVNVAKTGAGAAMLTWAGVPASDPRFQDTLDFLDRHWGDVGGCDGNLGNYYAMYGVMKGMVIPHPDVELIGTHDWYAEYARYIVDEQNAYGGEYVVDYSCWGPGGSGQIQNSLATAWALLILTPTVVQPPPVADAGSDVQDHPPLVPVEFDGSGSYHRDPTKEIVEYCWDFGDDSPEECSPDPTAEHAYPAVYHPDGTIDWPATVEDYEATLRVIDNNVPPLEDTDTLIVHITAPPWKPVADADGPYEGWENLAICLDGSGSYHPASAMYEPTHPWYDEIAAYEWDLDNDGQFDDSVGVNPCWTWENDGAYAVCLKVTDSVPSGPGGTIGDLDVDIDCATVVVRELTAILVSIDIKPGSYPNSVNPEKSRGVIPVAILTTEDFDATTVDPETVVFAGASPVHYAIKDVDKDRDHDLILHFRTQDTGIAPGDTEACLTGETFDGVPIVGCDSVRTVPVLEPLKIGLLVPYTGALSDFGAAFERSAKLAIKEINGAGGVLGSDVVLVTADSGTEPLKAQEEARRLIDIEKVSAIIGAAASGVTIPVAESVAAPSGILQISPSATSPALTVVDDDDFLFRTTISDAAQGLILAHLADDLGFTSACTMYIDNAYGQGLSEAFAQSFEYLGGTVTAQVPHPTEPQDSYLDELNQCVAANPDVLAAISYPEHASVYLREALDVGLMDMFLFVDGTKSDTMFEALGWHDFEGMYGTAPGSLELAAGTTFDNAYEAEYGEKPPMPFMRETYDAVYVIALAAAKADSADSTAIRDALRYIANPPGEVVGSGVAGFEGALELIAASTDIDYSGASGPLDFDENGDVPQGAIEAWQVAGGAIVEAVRTFEVDLGTTPPTVTEVTE